MGEASARTVERFTSEATEEMLLVSSGATVLRGLPLDHPHAPPMFVKNADTGLRQNVWGGTWSTLIKPLGRRFCTVDFESRRSGGVTVEDTL